MANNKLCNLVLLLSTFFLYAYVTQGSRTPVLLPRRQDCSSLTQGVSYLESSNGGEIAKNSKRVMIGSTAPTCTYNECRGCKYKCSAEQVPVEGNDPINSPYHYRCVCHR